MEKNKALVRIIILLFIFSIGTCLCSSGPLVGGRDIYQFIDGPSEQTFKSITNRLSEDPYDPGYFAWGLQYHVRGCLIMYNLTGQRKWLDWALNITDHFVEYSDVNGDGKPCWGNYNQTWGNDRYDFREYTVWDGVIGLPIIEAAQMIRSRPELRNDPQLMAKSNHYVALIERIIRRHQSAWTQISEDQGYYWDDFEEDIGPIVNRFTALGRVELVLGDVVGNSSYYERPGQMARYLVENMRYYEDQDLYTWSYHIGEGGSEDISHGAIELEFLIMANQRGLLEDLHLVRLCNTYLERVWQVPHILEGEHILSMKVDGSDGRDYARISRNWILLSMYNSTIFNRQRTVFGLLMQKQGIYPSSCSLLGLAQIPASYEALLSMGVDPYATPAVDQDLFQRMLNRTRARLDQASQMGSQCQDPSHLLEEAERIYKEAPVVNASVALYKMWTVWDILGRIIDAGSRLAMVREKVEDAEAIGVDTSNLEKNLSILQVDFVGATTASELSLLEEQLSVLTEQVKKLVAERLIEAAEDVIEEAKEAGIDTSRHQILLDRAREEYEKGNYGPASQFTNYPLSLREEIPEVPEIVLLLFILPFLVKGFPECNFY